MDEAFIEVLKDGGKSNSLGRSEEVLAEVLQNNNRLPELYDCISADDAWVRMRAIDTLEKILRIHPEWSKPFLDDIFTNLLVVDQPSIQWHLAQIFREVNLSEGQKVKATDWLSDLLSSTSVDWIVAANSMDTLVQFMDDELLSKSQLVNLLTIQLGHKSKSVVKRANKHLEALAKAP